MLDHRERAILGGVEALPDSDLLAIVLGTGSQGQSVTLLSAALLDGEGGLRGLARVGPHRLSLLRGIGPVKATRLAAAFELGRRAFAASLREAPVRVQGYAEVVAWASPRLAGLEHEEVWLLALDGRNALKTARRVAQGGLHGCSVTIRDVLSPALRDGASAIVLVHNHPSGDPRPSTEDVSMTRALATACDVVGVSLLDHVIVARHGASSLFEYGGV